MPFITVKIPKKELEMDIEKLAEAIAEKAGIKLDRVNLMIEYFDGKTLIRGHRKDYPLVQIASGDGNGLEFLQNIIRSSAYSVEDQLGLPRNSVTAYFNVVKDKCIFKDGKFK
jgi:phenylpyruvate tautomerase PptA (4-oxalocrotonate tautomerase family)